MKLLCWVCFEEIESGVACNKHAHHNQRFVGYDDKLNPKFDAKPVDFDMCVMCGYDMTGWNTAKDNVFSYQAACRRVGKCFNCLCKGDDRILSVIITSHLDKYFEEKRLMSAT